MSLEICPHIAIRSGPEKFHAGRTRALPTGLSISYACCVSATALQQPGQASPERVGEYSQTEPFYRALRTSVKRNGIFEKPPSREQE